MVKVHFEWDSDKDRINQSKHGIPFSLAQHAFLDSNRIIARDLQHMKKKNVIFVLER